MQLAAIEEQRMSEPQRQVDTRTSLFPHRYSAVAVAGAEGDVALEGERLPPLASAPPAQFDGPGDRWSPETLLVAAVADCYVLTFRAIARASKLPWLALRCDVEGILDRVDRVTQFTEFTTRASLRLPFGADDRRAARLLAKAEETCLITNSLKGAHHLEIEIDIEGG
jgi:organic hydroperoxide reductase OsmC/OhrA